MPRVIPWLLLLTAIMRPAEPPQAMEQARRSYALAQQGDLAGAAAAIREAIRLAPGNPLYLAALGGIAARQGNAKESKECFRRAVDLDPRNPALRFQLARSQWESGELEPARANALMLASAQPGNHDIQKLLEGISLDLGAELARAQRYKAGLVIAEDTARRYPQSAQAQQMLGLFAMRNQQNPAAVKAYQKALALSPESAGISVGLGIAQTMAGQLPEAQHTFEDGIRKWPNDAEHYQAFGVLLLRMAEAGAGSAERGVAMLRKALDLNPALPEAHFQLGKWALEQGDPAAAVDHFSAALRNGDTSSKVHFALSRAYRAAGQADASARHAALFQKYKRAESAR